ncbi:MAG: hypothetical protein LKJ17_07370 [Oscillospiraceae bacterium]|nr:hypothetical protein [Oscillospiraceae bacterium]
MKKSIIFMILTLCVLSFATACQNNAVSQNDRDYSPSVVKATQIPLKSAEWPENEYTKGILKPKVGTVSDGWINSNDRYLNILFSDVSEEDTKEYIELLKKDGFSLITDVREKPGENYISYDAVLKRDHTYLSFAYTNDTLGMCIKKLD